MPPNNLRQKVWRLAWPVILSNCSVPLLGMVDAAVMGHLDSPVYLGGVALGALIFDFLYWAIGFLRMGTTGFVAQAFGRRDNIEVRAIVIQSIQVALLLAIGVWTLAWPIEALSFYLLQAEAPVEAQGQLYFWARISGAPFVLVNM